ncbi:MAG: hypothetical protein KIT83_02230, partial [Bryobacterales bacterium]|nr:hypothetical protein [Bryobacterales bacterium]
MQELAFPFRGLGFGLVFRKQLQFAGDTERAQFLAPGGCHAGFVPLGALLIADVLEHLVDCSGGFALDSGRSGGGRSMGWVLAAWNERVRYGRDFLESAVMVRLRRRFAVHGRRGARPMTT